MAVSGQRVQLHDNRRRCWGFRLAAVALGLSVFAVLEMICILGDWGRITEYEDPFVGFTDIHPLFVLDEENEQYGIPQSRLKFFATDSFPAHKSPETFRIFCLGGSTVQGRPYSAPTAFTTWLRLALTAADGQRNWEVINCGGISYASYRLTPILEECLTHEPDLIVLCTGHNEFLEDRTYDHIKNASPVWSVPIRSLARLRSFTLYRQALLRTSGATTKTAGDERPQLPAEVDALLDYRNGIEAYHRDDERHAGVAAQFEQNLRRMISLAGEAGVPLILITPPSNLSDTPPFKSQHRDGLTDKELHQWNALAKDARSSYRDRLDKSIESLTQALVIDDCYATTYFELGKCYAARGLYEQARKMFVRARDEDVCPLRMPSSLEAALKRIAAETGTPLIDAHVLLERESRTGILGGGLLVDHVHPTFPGHQMIAAALLEKMTEQGRIHPSADWQTRRDAAYQKHFNSLDTLYHLHGQRTLENLRAWSQGRADGPPIESRKMNTQTPLMNEKQHEQRK